MPSLGKTLLAFALLHFVLHSQICLLLQVSLDFLLLHSNPYYETDIFFFFFLIFVLEGIVFTELFDFSSFGINGQAIYLAYYDTERLALETDIILSFLRLHPSTAFWILLLTMRVIHFF